MDMKRTEKDLKNTAVTPSGQMGNIGAVFSHLGDIAHLLSALLPQMQKLIDLMENSGLTSANPIPDGHSELQQKLAELLSIAKQTREDSGFVKMVFTQEKPKKTRKQPASSVAVNEYLHKYNRSMKR